MTDRKDPTSHLLLLAGSGEARSLAESLSARPELRVTALQLHAADHAGPLAVPTRIGDYCGEAGLEQILISEKITAVLDATHPFAVQASSETARLCARLGLPHAQVLRPAWQPGPGDCWREVADETAAAACLTAGQRVFTTTGRATLGALVAGTGATFLVRQKRENPPPPKMKNVRYVFGEGPFSVEEEMETLRALEIDVLVVKNSGGAASRTKLDAARALGLPVILIARPPQPEVTRLETFSQALDWVAAL